MLVGKPKLVEVSPNSLFRFWFLSLHSVLSLDLYSRRWSKDLGLRAVANSGSSSEAAARQFSETEARRDFLVGRDIGTEY